MEEDPGNVVHLQLEISLLHEKICIYEKMIQDQQFQIKNLIDKNDANCSLVTSTAKDCNHKLDMATSRILELETVLSLVKLETEEHMKANANFALQISQDQIRIKDIVLSLSSKFEDYRSSYLSQPRQTSPWGDNVTVLLENQIIEDFHSLTSSWNTLEGGLHEILSYQNQPTVLSHETSDLFTTINSLNNTIKTIKTKASSRLKKLNDQYHGLESNLQQVQSDYRECNMKHELLKAEHDQLQKISRQLERDIVITKTDLVRMRRQNEEINKDLHVKDQIVDQMYAKCDELQRERENLLNQVTDLSAAQQQNIVQKSLEEELKKKSGNFGGNTVKDLEDTIAALKLELSVCQQDAKRKLAKRKKELVSVYEEHRSMRIDYVTKEERFLMLLEDCSMKYQVLTGKYQNHQFEMNKMILKHNELDYRYKQMERSQEEVRVNHEIQQLKQRKIVEDIQRQLNNDKDSIAKLQEQNQQLQLSMEQKSKKWKANTHRVNEYERIVQELRLVIQEKNDIISKLQNSQNCFHLKEEEQFKAILVERVESMEKLCKMRWDDLEMQILKKSRQLLELSSVLEYAKVKQSSLLSQYKGQLSSIQLKSKHDMEKLQRRIDELHAMKVEEEVKANDHWRKQMTSDYQSLQEQHQTLTNQLDLVHQEVAQLQQSLKSVQSENGTLKTTIEIQNATIVDKTAEVSRHIEKIHQLQGIINQKQEQINEYYKRIKVSDDLTRQLSQEKDLLQEERNNFQEKLLEKQFAFDSLASQNQILRDENTTLVKRIGEDIRDQIKNLEKNIDELHQENGKYQQEIAKLHEKISQFELDSSELHMEIDVHLQEIQRLQDEHTQQEERHANILIQLNHEKSTLLQQLNYSTTSYVQVKQDLSSVQKDVISKDVEIKHLQDRLAIYKQEYRKQEKEMTKMVALFQQEFSSLQHQIADIATFDLTSAVGGNDFIDAIGNIEKHPRTDETNSIDESPLKTSHRVIEGRNDEQSGSNRTVKNPENVDEEEDTSIMLFPTSVGVPKRGETTDASPSRNNKREQDTKTEIVAVNNFDKFDHIHSHSSPRRSAPASPIKSLHHAMEDAAMMLQISKNLQTQTSEQGNRDERPKSVAGTKAGSSDRQKTTVKRMSKSKKVPSPSKRVPDSHSSPKSPKSRS